MSRQTVCDIEPCSRLLGSLRHHLTLDDRYDPEKGPLVAFLKRNGAPENDRVNFKYCPFCGTRLTYGTVETWALNRRLRLVAPTEAGAGGGYVSA